MRRKWGVVFESYDGDSSCEIGPCTLPTALLYYISPFEEFLRRRIVRHDTEMRAWDRPDWLTEPTPEEAAQAASRVAVPVMRPGDSASFKCPSAAPSDRLPR